MMMVDEERSKVEVLEAKQGISRGQCGARAGHTVERRKSSVNLEINSGNCTVRLR